MWQHHNAVELVTLNTMIVGSFKDFEAVVITPYKFLLSLTMLNGTHIDLKGADHHGADFFVTQDHDHSGFHFYLGK